MKRQSLFLKDPLWVYLLGITAFTFFLVDSYGGYVLASMLLVFSLGCIHVLYLGENLSLSQKISRQLEKFSNEFTIYSGIEISDGETSGSSDFLIISPKGIFNIRVLDFEGTISGFENDEYWEYLKVINPYDVIKTSIKNPIHLHRRTQRVLENLLEKNYIKYIPIQSIFVINNSEATLECNSNISVVKVKDLYNYISQYQDRSNIPPILQEISQVIGSSNFGGFVQQD
ncbi:nuclease-related domain-containing protein [Alkaliphilus transvaalensis]|uniref:nuclease-related domain-containing protein n=1 Tax=Alkaliphilus transvaalensis TaxID=114628 RepID=UPI00047E287E|nr:nuclease-related domain-containing protein [Alkaliphilus transvaalensis]